MLGLSVFEAVPKFGAQAELFTRGDRVFLVLRFDKKQSVSIPQLATGAQLGEVAGRANPGEQHENFVGIMGLAQDDTALLRVSWVRVWIRMGRKGKAERRLGLIDACRKAQNLVLLPWNRDGCVGRHLPIIQDGAVAGLLVFAGVGRFRPIPD